MVRVYIYRTCPFLRLVQVRVVQRLPADPHVDLATLALADYFIGNCVSTFSAFAVRERRGADRPVEFWAFNGPPPPHGEL